MDTARATQDRARGRSGLRRVIGESSCGDGAQAGTDDRSGQLGRNQG